MKDRQVPSKPPQLRIPILSAVLHCVSMTVIVFLRSSFGYAYLSPKSVFFAFSWAFTLFCLYAWHEPGAWPRYWLLCVSGLAAIALYVAHLVTAFGRELYRSGEHDHDSGTPHALRLLRRAGKGTSAAFQRNWHVWSEPGMILLAGLALRYIAGERHLSMWLLVVAPCFWLKEVLNVWFQLRQLKRHEDSREDAEDIFEDAVSAAPVAAAPKPAGKEKIRRARAGSQSAADELAERRFAQVLRLMPPFTLEEAERNYRKLVKERHPDASENGEGSEAATAELNEAIAWFRAKAGGGRSS